MSYLVEVLALAILCSLQPIRAAYSGSLDCERSKPLNKSARELKFIEFTWILCDDSKAVRNQTITVDKGCQGVFPGNLTYAVSLWTDQDTLPSYNCIDEVWDMYSVHTNAKDGLTLFWICKDLSTVPEDGMDLAYALVNLNVPVPQKITKYLRKHNYNPDSLLVNSSYLTGIKESQLCQRWFCNYLKTKQSSHEDTSTPSPSQPRSGDAFSAEETNIIFLGFCCAMTVFFYKVIVF